MLRGHARILTEANYSLGLLLSSPLQMQFLFGGRETRKRQILKTTKNYAGRVCSKCYWEDPRKPQDAPAAPVLSRRGPCTGRRAALINVASPGAERGARRVAHAHSVSRSPWATKGRGTRSLGGEAASSVERWSYLPAEDGDGRAGDLENDAARGTRRPGKKGAERASPRTPSRDSPAPRFPPLRIPIFCKEKVYFEGVRKGPGYSHGLQGFAEPGFQRLEVFYDHFNHHPERPGPPASPPAATAAAAAPAAGSAPPRRRHPTPAAPPRTLRRLPVRQRPPGSGRRPSDTEGAEPVEQRLLLAGPALAAALPGSASRALRGFPPPESGAAECGGGGAVRDGRPPRRLSRSARRSERPSERVRWRRPAVARAQFSRGRAARGGCREAGLGGGLAGLGAGGMACGAARWSLQSPDVRWGCGWTEQCSRDKRNTMCIPDWCLKCACTRFVSWKGW